MTYSKLLRRLVCLRYKKLTNPTVRLDKIKYRKYENNAQKNKFISPNFNYLLINKQGLFYAV